MLPYIPSAKHNEGTEILIQSTIVLRTSERPGEAEGITRRQSARNRDHQNNCGVATMVEKAEHDHPHDTTVFLLP
jgi:hypothetical protein